MISVRSVPLVNSQDLLSYDCVVIFTPAIHRILNIGFTYISNIYGILGSVSVLQIKKQRI